MNRTFTNRAIALLSWSFLALSLGYICHKVDQRRPVILHNASVLTINTDDDIAQALMWRNGIIESVGSNQSVLSHNRWYTKVRNLRGKVVIPGFVDAHSHFPASGVSAVTLDLGSPPLGTVDSLATLYQRVSEQVRTLPEGHWVVGFNYDQSSLSDGMHPRLEVLDEIAPQHPVYLYHSSGHMGVANTLALKALDKSAAGSIYSGLLQESAAPNLATLMSRLGLRAQLSAFLAARDEYARAGVTTVMNGAAGTGLLKTLWLLSGTALMPLRTLVSPKAATLTGSSGEPLLSWQQARERYQSPYFFFGPAKFTIDGSPQGYTAFLAQPYRVPPPERQDKPGWRGQAFYGLQELSRNLSLLRGAGWQLALHGNGDAAIDLILESLREAGLSATDDQRPVLVHAQTARADQIKSMLELGVSPTFFISHVYYWGEWHRARILGPARAENISPTGWAQQSGLRYTLHSDAPVTPMRPLDLLRQAVTRQTLQGRTLGPGQRISPKQALRALTIDAAWQYRLEQQVGSIETGKFADLVILDQSPLTFFEADQEAESVALESALVRETIVGGRTVYRRRP